MIHDHLSPAITDLLTLFPTMTWNILIISEEDTIEPGKREGIYCTVYKHLQSSARMSMGKFIMRTLLYILNIVYYQASYYLNLSYLIYLLFNLSLDISISSMILLNINFCKIQLFKALTGGPSGSFNQSYVCTNRSL